MTPILEAKNVSKSYGVYQALKDVSLKFFEGETVSIVGPNGAGKTTTLRGLSGMLPYEGSVELEGRSLKGLSADRIVHLGMAHVPEGRGIFGGLTVMENLRLGAWVRRDAAARNRDLEWVLGVFPRLRERLDQLAGTLSGGEQQMLSVARAIMSEARLFLLDEPSMGLAPKLVMEIFSVLRELNKRGATILLVEQNANLALRLADRACLLETGSIVLEGPSADLLSNSRVREAYLGA